nr:hypothetical protein [Tanacetum cinerariifolium]
ESLLNRDTLIDSSPKFDYLLEEFSGELAHIDLIPPRIEEVEFDLKEEIRIVENLFDSHMEEIDLFLAMDDLIPPGIENDDYDLEGDIHFLKELLSNDPLPLPKNEIAPDLEASCARGFVHHPLELQSLAYGNPIS